MKIPYLRTALFLLLLTATYFFYIHADIINLNNVLTAPYSPDDSETLYTLSSVVYRGGGLYKDFSLVYPPGRFLFQSLLFHLISPSMTVLSLYTTFPRILFPSILFLLSYYLFSALPNSKKNFITLAFFSSIAFFTYMSYVRSAQEAHVLAALFFFIAFVPMQKHRLRKFLLGLLYGLIFLFRIDSGIMLTLSLLAAFTIREKKLPRIQIAGTALVWIPIVLLILIKGSISHFLYDTFYLGLIVQPKMMGLPIPPPPFGKIYPALLSLIFCSSLALIFDAKKIKDTFLRYMVQTFAIFASLRHWADLTSRIFGMEQSGLGSCWLTAYLRSTLIIKL